MDFYNVALAVLFSAVMLYILILIVYQIKSKTLLFGANFLKGHYDEEYELFHAHHSTSKHHHHKKKHHKKKHVVEHNFWIIIGIEIFVMLFLIYRFVVYLLG